MWLFAPPLLSAEPLKFAHCGDQLSSRLRLSIICQLQILFHIALSQITRVWTIQSYALITVPCMARLGLRLSRETAFCLNLPDLLESFVDACI